MTDGESIDVRLNRILSQISSEAPAFSGVAIGDPNGLPLASTLKGPKTLSATALSVMALSVGQNVTSLLSLPGKARIRIEGDSWEVVVIPLTLGFAFIGLTQGPALLEAQAAALGRHLTELQEAIRGLVGPREPRR